METGAIDATRPGRQRNRFYFARILRKLHDEEFFAIRVRGGRGSRGRPNSPNCRRSVEIARPRRHTLGSRSGFPARYDSLKRRRASNTLDGLVEKLAHLAAYYVIVRGQRRPGRGDLECQQSTRRPRAPSTEEYLIRNGVFATPDSPRRGRSECSYEKSNFW